MTRIRSALGGGLALAALAAAALPPGPAAAQGAGTGGETYVFALPDTWRPAERTQQGGAEIMTFLPPGQTLSEWRDMAILQVYEGITGMPPETLRERTLESMEAACTDATAGTLQTGTSNGYPSGFWVIACARNTATGKGEVAYFRSLHGQEDLYVVQRVWTMPPFGQTPPALPAEEKREAVGILSALSACVPGSAAHPCPGR